MSRSLSGAARRWPVLLAVMAVLLLLSACSLRMDLTLLKDQAWEMKAYLTFPTGMLDLGGAEVTQQMAEAMDQAVAEARAQGLEMSWHEEGAGSGMGTYVIEARGKGYEDLAGSGFTLEEVDYRGARALRVAFTGLGDLAGLGSVLGGEVGGLAGQLMDYNITIRGGEVLETDGRVSGSAVTWANPRSGYAILTPEGSGGNLPPWAWVIIALALVAVAGVAAWMVLGRRGSAVRPAQYVGAGGAMPPADVTCFCPNCGAPGQTRGRFCSQCGQRIP